MLPLFIIFFTLSPILSLTQNIQKFNDCTTKLYTCGDTIRWIGYPFWGHDRPSYCGIPEFRLTCRDDGVTTFQIINTTFRVLNINQSISRITIALDDLWKEPDACSLRPQASIDDNSFQQTVVAYIPDRFMFLGLHLSCVENEIEDNLISNRNRLNCLGDEGGRVSFFQNGSIYLGRESCESEIIVPVLKMAFDEFMRSETASLTDVLKQGFPIEYRVDGGAICSRCEGSGGTCWTNNNSSIPSCLCPTGIPRLVVCPASSVLNDCGCVGFNSSTTNGTGCSIWTGNNSFWVNTYDNSMLKYVISQNAINPSTGNEKEKNKNLIWILISVSIPLVFLCLWLLWYIKKRKQDNVRRKRDEYFLELTASQSFKDVHQLEGNGGNGNELLLFSLASIMAATGDFSVENKLGQGGFGPVYKGKLSDGREIAVKRLSRTSGQGLVEFKNELVLITKLQHTNLVRVLGCCIHKEEKMLIYEYMPNKSLDFFLFDENRKAEMDWPKRYNIIEGIAQGLLYLHKYSRMRVIHRDLKANNILLDERMNPKISDFGMARIFKQNETEAMTKRVVGTYGYMPPEYAMEGTFSIKSDIFSFGVLILEIVTGRRNSSFVHLDRTFNLIEYAWELWRKGGTLELMDPSLGSTCVVHEFSRIVHVAILCVQESATDRPTTSDMISMLLNDTMLLPTPNKPAFVIRREETRSTSYESRPKDCSINNMTISSVMDGR